jgi:hypothetical protein
MECRDVQNLLSEYIDGVLSESLAPVVKQHIATCDQCQDTYHSMNRMIGVMREMEPVDEPADFRAGVRARLEKRPSVASRLRPLFYPPRVKVPLGVAAALVVAVVIWVLPRPEQPVPEQAQLSDDRVPNGAKGRTALYGKKDSSTAGPGFEGFNVAGRTDNKGPDPLTPGQVAPKSGEVVEDEGRQITSDPPATGAAGDTTEKLTAEEEVAAARPESLDQELLDIDALMEVTTMEKKSVPAPAEGDPAIADAETVPAARAPVDSRVAAAGGKLVDTVTNINGETVALIAQVPVDSLQVLYRLFGRENVTSPADILLSSPPSTRVRESSTPRTTGDSGRKANSSGTATSPTDSIYVRIRIRP